MRTINATLRDARQTSYPHVFYRAGQTSNRVALRDQVKPAVAVARHQSVLFGVIIRALCGLNGPVVRMRSTGAGQTSNRVALLDRAVV